MSLVVKPDDVLELTIHDLVYHHVLAETERFQVFHLFKVLGSVFLMVMLYKVSWAVEKDGQVVLWDVNITARNSICNYILERVVFKPGGLHQIVIKSLQLRYCACVFKL
jgi:hypothetical protein